MGSNCSAGAHRGTSPETKSHRPVAGHVDMEQILHAPILNGTGAPSRGLRRAASRLGKIARQNSGMTICAQLEERELNLARRASDLPLAKLYEKRVRRQQEREMKLQRMFGGHDDDASVCMSTASSAGLANEPSRVVRQLSMDLSSWSPDSPRHDASCDVDTDDVDTPAELSSVCSTRSMRSTYTPLSSSTGNVTATSGCCGASTGSQQPPDGVGGALMQLVARSGLTAAAMKTPLPPSRSPAKPYIHRSPHRVLDFDRFDQSVATSTPSHTGMTSPENVGPPAQSDSMQSTPSTFFAGQDREPSCSDSVHDNMSVASSSHHPQTRMPAPTPPQVSPCRSHASRRVSIISEMDAGSLSQEYMDLSGHLERDLTSALSALRRRGSVTFGPVEPTSSDTTVVQRRHSCPTHTHSESSLADALSIMGPPMTQRMMRARANSARAPAVPPFSLSRGVASVQAVATRTAFCSKLAKQSSRRVRKSI